MTDIPALIEDLKREYPISERDPRTAVSRAIDALSLSVSPLPGEIEELAEDLRHHKTEGCEDCDQCQTIEKAAAALERMTREIERLKGIEEKGAVYFFDKWDDERETTALLRARIRELEAEAAAIQAKTIEDCAQICEGAASRGENELIAAVCQSNARLIRALKPAGDGKENP